MTTPGSHNDTYASTCHRMFFANYVKKVDPVSCPDNDGHNVDAIDALTLAVPVIIKYQALPRQDLYKKVNDCISVTRKTSSVEVYSMAFTDILVDVLEGNDLRDSLESVGAKYFKGSVKQMSKQ